MPRIFVFGMPGSVPQNELVGLIKRIQNAVAALPVFEIPAEEVTVFFPCDRVDEGLGEELVCEIKGLYRKNKMAPSTFVLRETVGAQLQKFAENHLPQCREVEVLPTTTMEPENGVTMKVGEPMVRFKWGGTYEVSARSRTIYPSNAIACVSVARMPDGEYIALSWKDGANPPEICRVDPIPQPPSFVLYFPVYKVMDEG